MAGAKVSINGTTIMDISDTTANAEDVGGNKVFYNAAGVRTVGTGSGYVLKSGDTITGDITYKTTWDRTTNPSTAPTTVHLEVKDKNDNQLMFIQNWQNTDGTISGNIGVTGRTGSSSSISFSVDTSGNKTINMNGDVVASNVKTLSLKDTAPVIRRDGSAAQIISQSAAGSNRGIINIGTNNNYWFRQVVTTGGSVYEDYHLPTSNATTSISMDIVAKKFLGSTSSSASSTFTLPKAGTWLIVTTHNSTDALNGIWIANTGGNKIVKMGGGANISFTLSGTTLSCGATTGGGAGVNAILLKQT